jgi:general secretion pathway protein G
MNESQGSSRRGVGVVDLVIGMVVVSLMAALGIPAFNGFVDRANVAQAIGDMGSISVAIESYRLKNHDRMPGSIEELNIGIVKDPWGRDYQYVNFMAAEQGKPDSRMDASLNRLNTDFDLYSLGRDGETSTPVNAEASRDDVVRANNGVFIGLGEDY